MFFEKKNLINDSFKSIFKQNIFNKNTLNKNTIKCDLNYLKNQKKFPNEFIVFILTLNMDESNILLVI